MAMNVASRWNRDVPNLLGVNDLVQIWTDPNGYLVDLDLDDRPIVEGLEEAAKALGRSTALDELLRRARTGEYYSPYGEGKHPHTSCDIPVQHRVAWYDPGLVPYGMTDYRHFHSMASQGDNHSLCAAAADHGGFLLSDVGRGDERNPYPNDAVMAEMQSAEAAEIIEFFDRHLDGRASLPEPARARWQIGNGTWRSSAEWPPKAGPAHGVLLRRRSGCYRRQLWSAGRHATRAAASDPFGP
jgi:predicted acyl esterase